MKTRLAKKSSKPTARKSSRLAGGGILARHPNGLPVLASGGRPTHFTEAELNRVLDKLFKRERHSVVAVPAGDE